MSHHDDTVNEIDLLVGSVFTVTENEDRDEFEFQREYYAAIQDILRENGIEADLVSRPGTEVWEGGIARYNDLYRLCQVVAYLEHGLDISKFAKKLNSVDEDVDALLIKIWDEEKPTRFPHLIKHKVDGGFYLPQDFEEPVLLEMEEEEEEGEEDEEMEDNTLCFGSSQRLQKELVEAEALINAANLDPKQARGILTCLQTLKQAAELSLKNDLPIVLW